MLFILLCSIIGLGLGAFLSAPLHRLLCDVETQTIFYLLCGAVGLWFVLFLGFIFIYL